VVYAKLTNLLQSNKTIPININIPPIHVPKFGISIKTINPSKEVIKGDRNR
jgi:hypothetical protein